MNKKLIAIAIAGAMSAPFAANAGEATIYGVMDVSVDHIDNDELMDDPATVADESNGEESGLGVSSNSSRIGFKGSEDLGGGMKAIWQVETGVNVGNGTSQWAGRNTFAGLAGGFGTVVLGRHDTPLKGTGRKADFFGNSVGDSRNVISAGGAIDLRPDNVIGYISPSMGGFNVFAAYVTDGSYLAGADDRMAENNDLDAYSLSLNYSAGPLYVSFATEELGFSELDANNDGNEDNPAAEDQQTHRLVASYKMGAFKVAGLWQDMSDANGTDGMDQTTWGLGGSYTMGNNTVKAQYYTADEYDGTGNDDTGGNMFALGLDHAMSKQTKLYAVYAASDNDDATNNYRLGGGGHGDTGPGTLAAGADASAFSVGMTHKF
ncbi:MAG TPA: porin [Gammaproteobacteria bacterium]|nr:porin [Gammaproteobacteria bacterium]